MMNSVIVHPCRAFAGTVQVPGDKSISHRMAMLGALARGTTVAHGFLRSDDSTTILTALGQLGVAHGWEGGALRIEGCGPVLRESVCTLDMGNSGTGMRLLAGLLAGQRFTTATLIGDASLSSRPMRRIQEPLRQMGGKVELLGADGRPPVRITGAALHGIEYATPVASAQVKSCILLAALFAEGRTVVVEPRPTRDHTERLFQAIGIPLQIDGPRIAVTGFGPQGPVFQGRTWKVPGDFSSAAFWITAAACVPGREVRVVGVGLNPRRSALLGVLRRMGARVEVTAGSTAADWEATGTVLVRGAALRGVEVEPDEIPDLIDELPLVAIAGALAQGRTVIRGAGELRVKESDRIAALVGNLRQLGVKAEELPDGLIVEGGTPIRGGVELDSHGDHRIPMGMAVLALSAGAPLRLRDVDCVGKSYPAFWQDLQQLGGRVECPGGH